MSSHTFISHSASDESTATWWCQALEREGLACWVAPRDIPAGADWAAEIIEGLNAALRDAVAAHRIGHVLAAGAT